MHISKKKLKIHRKSLQSTESVQEREENTRAMAELLFRWENAIDHFVAMIVWMKEEKNHIHLLRILIHSDHHL